MGLWHEHSPVINPQFFQFFPHFEAAVLYEQWEKPCLGFFFWMKSYTVIWELPVKTIIRIPIKQPVPSLKLTANAPEIGPSQKDMSSSKASIFRGELLVAGRVYMDVSLNSGFSPQIIHFNRVFHYKPSILGCFTIFGNTYILENCECFFIPCGSNLCFWQSYHPGWLISWGGNWSCGSYVTWLLRFCCKFDDCLKW